MLEVGAREGDGVTAESELIGKKCRGSHAQIMNCCWRDMQCTCGVWSGGVVRKTTELHILCLPKMVAVGSPPPGGHRDQQ